MKIGIIGSGWLGTRVAQKLENENEIFVTTRSNENTAHLKSLGFETFQIDFQAGFDLKTAELFRSLDVVIISLPVSKKRFSEEMAKNAQEFLEDFQGQVIFFSSVGVYPHEDGIYTEKSTENLNKNISAAEDFYKNAFPQINILRFGGLMGDERKFSKYFENKALPKPDDLVNHIHYEDIAEIVDHLIKNKTKGKLYNVVAPLHPTKQQVFDYQTKNIDSEIEEAKESRIVLGSLLEEELNYQFLKPNPMEY
jgi:nucleoside-diphosphate-sugar epimerase